MTVPGALLAPLALVLAVPVGVDEELEELHAAAATAVAASSMPTA
ncbi:MAG: hypothetical protein ACRDP7_35415 [Trebonia sp.]